jgi:hypothetical protein
MYTTGAVSAVSEPAAGEAGRWSAGEARSACETCADTEPVRDRKHLTCVRVSTRVLAIRVQCAHISCCKL